MVLYPIPLVVKSTVAATSALTDATSTPAAKLTSISAPPKPALDNSGDAALNLASTIEEALKFIFLAHDHAKDSGTYTH